MAVFRIICFFTVIYSTAAQTYKVCVPSSSSLCPSLDKDGSQAVCQGVASRVDCALRLERGEVDIGYFSEEEIMLLAQQQPTDNRVVATVRDVSRMEPFAFETVAIVPSRHTGGLEGLRGGRYCHPGLDEQDYRWSPRVLKALELNAARTDRCPETSTAQKTAEELEVETLSNFFSAACRPGDWSANSTVDANLKNRYPSLCSLCGPNPSCSGYTLDMGVPVPGVRNENRHIQALECLRVNSSDTTPAVAYVAWTHVKEFFTIRNPQVASSFAILCPNGSLVNLSPDLLTNSTSPCPFISQPWGAIVASTNQADTVLNNLRIWWPSGTNPGGNTWQSVLFTVLAGGSNARVVFQETPLSPANYTAPIRTIPAIDSTASCLPTRRWCTLSAAEQSKCTWTRNAAYTLGVEPTINCQQRSNVLECLADIQADRTDFISSPSNYGFLARQKYRLAPVKLVQNTRNASSRIAAFVKESSAQNNITRFENLRDTKACFPEFGGLAYVAFIRAAHERGVISSTQCDYATAVSEFFSGACAPGAEDASHALGDISVDGKSLCSVCRAAIAPLGNVSESICTWDYTNMYFGNNGSLACLNDPETSVAFLNIQNINNHITSLGLQTNQFRALCFNNSLAVNAGVDVEDNCLLAHVVDADVLTRRDDPHFNSLNTMFDALDLYFGYNAAPANQLINFYLFSPFDGINDLLFKDSTIGLTEPIGSSAHAPAGNYIELFRHLQSCTSTAAPLPGLATRSVYSLVGLLVMSMMTTFMFSY